MLQENERWGSNQSNTEYQDATAADEMSPGEETPLSQSPAETQGELPVGRAIAYRLLTISDIAEWLGVSKAWVYDHTTRKKPMLPCVRLGEMTRFRPQDIEKFIQEHLQFSGPK